MIRKALALLAVLLPIEARAQLVATSFDELRPLLKPGERIEITDSNGRLARGRVVELSPAALDVLIRESQSEGRDALAAQRRFAELDIRQIQIEHRDSLWNGTLIGLGTAALPGMATIAYGLQATRDGYTTGPEVAGAGLIFLGIGAGVGALVDASIHGRTTVFIRPAASTFDELRRLVKVDETVVVTDAAGAIHKGQLDGLSDSTLQLRGAGSRNGFSERDVNNIAVVRSDPLWNGMLIGFAAAAAPVALTGVGASARPADIAAIACGYGTVGLLTGLVIDAVNKNPLTIYGHRSERSESRSRISVHPIVSPGRVAIGIGLQY
jgi:hypothetical protein